MRPEKRGMKFLVTRDDSVEKFRIFDQTPRRAGCNDAEVTVLEANDPFSYIHNFKLGSDGRRHHLPVLRFPLFHLNEKLPGALLL